MDETRLEVTRKQKLAGNICSVAALGLCGLFLLLCGISVIPFDFSSVVSSAALFTITVIFLIGGLIQKNPVSVFLAIVFFIPGLIETSVYFAYFEYAVLYPLYIATPAIASLITGLIFRSLRPHIPVLIFFGGLSVIFALQSSGILGWAFVIPAALLFIGGCVLWIAVKTHRRRKRDSDA